jgi:hypothetical protein
MFSIAELTAAAQYLLIRALSDISAERRSRLTISGTKSQRELLGE